MWINDSIWWCATTIKRKTMATHLHTCNSTVYLFKARSAIIRLVRWLFCVAVDRNRNRTMHICLLCMVRWRLCNGNFCECLKWNNTWLEILLTFLQKCCIANAVYVRGNKNQKLQQCLPWKLIQISFITLKNMRWRLSFFFILIALLHIFCGVFWFSLNAQHHNLIFLWLRCVMRFDSKQAHRIWGKR